VWYLKQWPTMTSGFGVFFFHHGWFTQLYLCVTTLTGICKTNWRACSTLQL
jgi:hypothetical protein